MPEINNGLQPAHDEETAPTVPIKPIELQSNVESLVFPPAMRFLALVIRQTHVPSQPRETE